MILPLSTGSCSTVLQLRRRDIGIELKRTEKAIEGRAEFEGVTDIARHCQMEYSAYAAKNLVESLGLKSVIKELIRECREEIIKQGGEWDEENYGRPQEQNNDTLVEMLYSDGITLKCGAIAELTRRKIIDNDVINRIKELKKDNGSFWHDYLVSDFAYAALDVLGIDRYMGNKKETKELINVKLDFR